MACDSNMRVGRDYLVSVAFEDCTATPLSTATTPISTWKKLALVSTSALSINPRLTDSVNDGSYTPDKKGTGIECQVTVTGNDVPDSAKSCLIELEDFMFTRYMSGGTAKLWIKIEAKFDDAGTAKKRVQYLYAVASSKENSAGLEDNATSNVTFDMVPTYIDLNPQYQSEIVTV